MTTSIRTAAIHGTEALLAGVTAERGVRGGGKAGRPIIVEGLAAGLVRERAMVLRAALDYAGVLVPKAGVTLTVSPDLGTRARTGADLALAVAAVVECDLPRTCLDWTRTTLFYAELGLDGRLRPVRGTLAVALACRDAGVRRLFVARDNAAEAALVPGVEAVAAESLVEVIDHLSALSNAPATRFEALGSDADLPVGSPDFADVRGQRAAKRAFEVAAAGGHHMLLTGPAGSGKTMLARRLATILPPMTGSEILEASVVHSVAGLQSAGPLVRTRQTRCPHHTVSHTGLFGGGAGAPRPGEVSLAHNGVLFLDELSEFDTTLLEELCTPLDTGTVRTAGTESVSMPSRFTLVAACSPCPCGRHTDTTGRCQCTPHQIARYRSRIPASLLDRISIRIELPALRYAELGAAGDGDSSSVIRARVVAARARQARRHGAMRVTARTNGELPAAFVRTCCLLEPSAEVSLTSAAARMQLPEGEQLHVIALAQTIADLDGRDRINEADVAEAIGYRAGVPVAAAATD